MWFNDSRKERETSLVEYPPLANSCPDNWLQQTDNDGNEKIYCKFHLWI